MKSLPKGLVSEIEDLFDKHEMNNLDKADALGQIAASLSGIYLANTMQWLPGGMAFKYAVDNDVANTLKRAVENNAQPLVYCDDDCSLHGEYFDIHHECLDCKDKLMIRLFKKESIPTESCTRCNGTGIDPEYIDPAWVLHYKNHGYDVLFVVLGRDVETGIHIRKFEYNSDREDIKAKIQSVVSGLRNNDDHIPMITYKDTRDEGFCLSLTYREDKRESHSCEVNNEGFHLLTTVVEHFTAVEEKTN
jgi:hypothetical protein